MTALATASSTKNATFTACQISWKYDPMKLGFLDLPAEIRLMTYPALFTSMSRDQYSNGQAPNGQAHEEYPEYAVPSVHISTDSSRPHVPLPSALKLTKHSTHTWEDTFYPEILATCRTVHNEASPLLRLAYYRETAFSFYLNSHVETLPNRADLTRACATLFDYEPSDWRRERLPRALMDNEFAAFLNHIGKAKALQISHLIIQAQNCDDVASELPLIQELVMMHLPNVKQLDVSVDTVRVCWAESPDYMHPNRSSPFWSNGEFRPMYLALTNFVRDVSWLKRIGYSGQRDFGEDREGWDLLKRLETEVWEREIRGDGDDEVRKEDDDDGGVGWTGDGEEGEEEEIEEEEQEQHEIDDLLAITGFIDTFYKDMDTHQKGKSHYSFSSPMNHWLVVVISLA